MVALPSDENDENGIQKIPQDGSISGDGTIVEMCGIKSPRNGLAKKNWMRPRRRKSTLEEKHKCVTLVKSRIHPLSTKRKRVKGLGRRSKTRHPETWDPQIPLSTLAVMGLPYNCVVIVM